MFRNGQHLHHRFPRMGNVDSLVPWWGIRFDTDPDGGDGGGTGGAGGGVKMAQAMTQAAFDAIVRDAKDQARRSEREKITAKYGDLDTLKDKADAAQDTSSVDALTALVKVLVPDAKEGDSIKDLAAKAATRAEALVDVEAEKAKADLLGVRQEALKTAGLNPDLAGVLVLEGTTAEDLAKEITDKKLAETVGAAKPVPVPKVPVGGGTNPVDPGKPAANTLSEAIADHYGTDQKPA